MNLEGKKFLITGGAGFIGSHLVDVLAAHRVRILDDFSTGRRENLSRHLNHAGIEVREGDVRDAETVVEAIHGVDVVFHLACRGVRHSIGLPVANHEVNATGTLNVLQAARAAGVTRFVHVSSSEVYGSARYVPMDEDHPCYPATMYGASKLAGECYARAFQRTYALPAVVVRPFNNFGPRSHHEGESGEVIPRFIVWALANRPPVIFGDGTQTRDFIDVRETASWLVRIAESDAAVGRTINLGSGRETTVRELAAIVCHEADRPDLLPRFLPARPGDVHRHLAGVELARELIGFEPRTSLRAGIRHLIDDLRSRPEGLAALLARVPEVNWESTAPEARP